MSLVRAVTNARVMTRRRIAGLAVTVAGLGAIVVATLTAAGGTPRPSSPWCLTCSSLASADAVVNILLFLPAGVGLGLLAPRVLPALLGLALMSSAIEIAQAWIVPGRASALRDVLTNTLGGGIGIWLASHAHAWLRPRAVVARWLAVAGALAWAGTLGTTMALTRPSTPPGDYYGQRGSVGEFGSAVVHVAINGIPIPLGPLEDPAPVLAALNSRDVDVEVAVAPGVIPDGIGPIARLSHPGSEAFRLAQSGRTLTFSLRLRATDARLRSPVVRLRGHTGERVPPIDTLHLRAGVRDGVLHVSRDGPAAGAEALPLAPTIGWAFLTPPTIASRAPVWALSALWVAAFCFPIGYWTGWAGDVRRRSIGAGAPTGAVAFQLGVAAIVVGALALLPVVAATPRPPWSDWCVALVALIGGALTARSVRGSGPESPRAITPIGHQSR